MWRSLSRHCATAGSIPDGVVENFIDIVLPAALLPLTEMSTRSISWG